MMSLSINGISAVLRDVQIICVIAVCVKTKIFKPVYFCFALLEHKTFHDNNGEGCLFWLRIVLATKLEHLLPDVDA
jgi:hypothetical protein